METQNIDILLQRNAELEKELAAKNRELQIEAALEKVRSRALAMQNPAELVEVAQLLRNEMGLLGIEELEGSCISVHNESTGKTDIWYAIKDEKRENKLVVASISMYLEETWVGRQMLQFYRSGQKQTSIPMKGAHRTEWISYFADHSSAALGRFYDDKIPDRTYHLYRFSNGFIGAASPGNISQESWNLLQRATTVFSMAYTRFSDLQKAEEQAREARIEAALERVRSRTMAMQESEELREVIQVIFDQLCGLHFNINSASFVVEINETNDLRNWLAAPGKQYASRIDVPYINHPIFDRFVEAKEKGETFYTLQLTKEEKDRFFDYYLMFAPILEDRKKLIYDSMGWAQSAVLMNTIGLSITNYAPLPYSEEQNKILVRFGKAFEQTYTRFLDLQKSEALAREAIKQASVDRVRAEIASMRTTKDLDSIIPVVWNELTILNIPFIRCGVFIVNEADKQTHVYLSTPQGKAIASFQLPFDSKGLNDQMLQHWSNNQILKDQWDAAAFSAWTHSLVESGAIETDERYSKEKPPENLYLHFVPFMQGMLYVGSTQPLSADELSLIQSLADAFSTAYARYEDFNKLEAAKQQIEVTLAELKATQSQLIQKEKMASLGELTAGIAHEIQNPLNFVNNFSETNKELVAELKDELKSQNYLEVENIATDIANNEEKINHHGKRADNIVKSMLQHARKSSSEKQPTDINKLTEEYLRLSYHGMRAKDKDFNAAVGTHFDANLGNVNGVPQDIGRVLINLFNNAFYAVAEKKAKLSCTYEPYVQVSTRKDGNNIVIAVKDNGTGMSQRTAEKVFQPFFTTKPTGEGTGLGLSLSYDIITKGHGGTLSAESTEGEGSEFVVMLPTQ